MKKRGNPIACNTARQIRHWARLDSSRTDKTVGVFSDIRLVGKLAKPATKTRDRSNIALHELCAHPRVTSMNTQAQNQTFQQRSFSRKWASRSKSKPSSPRRGRS